MKKNIHDIALMAGVSTATVSRVVNGIGQVSEDTRAKVMKTVREVGYTPRGTVMRRERGVLAKRGGSIALVFCFNPEPERFKIIEDGVDWFRDGIISPDVFFSAEQCYDSSFFHAISEGVTCEARRQGLKAMVHCVDKGRLCDPSLTRTLKQDNAAGVILSGEHPLRIADFILKHSIPIVFADIIADEGPPEVTTDNYAGMSQAFEHVFSLGHRKIGFAMGPDIPEYRERYNAFGMMMAEKGIRLEQNWVYRGVNRVVDIGSWSFEILSGKDRPTAFLCANDFAALGILRGAVVSRTRVPDQLSIVGFDDIDTTRIVTPALTTVRVPKSDIGRLSARELIWAVGNARQTLNPVQCRIRLKPSLVIRESTAEA